MSVWTQVWTEPKSQIQQKPRLCCGSDIMEGILSVLSCLSLPKLHATATAISILQVENRNSEKVTRLSNVTQLGSSRIVGCQHAGLWPWHSCFLLESLAKNAYSFTQLFLVPTGQLPRAPGNLPTEKKKKPRPVLKTWKWTLWDLKAHVLLLPFERKRVRIIATKEQKLSVFIHPYLSCVFFKKKIF